MFFLRNELKWKQHSAYLHDKIENIYNESSPNITKACNYYLCNPSLTHQLFKFEENDDEYFGATFDRVALNVNHDDVLIKCPYYKISTQIPIAWLLQMHMQMAIRNKLYIRCFIVHWGCVDKLSNVDIYYRKIACVNPNQDKHMTPIKISTWRIWFSETMWGYMLPRMRKFCKTLKYNMTHDDSFKSLPFNYKGRNPCILQNPKILPNNVSVHMDHLFDYERE